MLAGHAVEPALPAAGDGEIRRIDGKHAAILHHAPVKPVGDGKRDAPALFGLGVDEVIPLVNPAEHRGFLAALGADIGGDDRRLEPFQRIAQLGVVLAARASVRWP